MKKNKLTLSKKTVYRFSEGQNGKNNKNITEPSWPTTYTLPSF